MASNSKQDIVKQEIIIKERMSGSNKVDAYRKAFPKASYATAKNEAVKYIDRHDLDKRALQRMAEAGLTEGDLFGKLKEHVNGTDGRISFDATKFGLGMIGYGKDQKLAESSYSPTQINIIIRSNRETYTPNTNDAIEIQANES